MDSGLFAAVNGALRTEMRLEVLANNLANVNTTGFKEGNITFDSYITKPGPEQHPLPSDKFLGIRSPADIPFPYTNPAANALSVTYPRADGTHTDMTQGALVPTGGALDVAIDGDGFFLMDTPQGRRYTRDGAFQVNTEGLLVSKDGFPVLGAGNAPLNVGNGPVEIGVDGTVSTPAGLIGRLQRVGIPVESLGKMGQNLYSAPQEREIPLDGARGGFRQGFLEGSNANPIKGMTQMIEANRAFESYMKMIRALDGLDGQAVQIGKLS